VPPGCWYHFQIWGKVFNLSFYAPYNCINPVYNSGWGDQLILIYDWVSQTFPVIHRDQPLDKPENWGYCAAVHPTMDTVTGAGGPDLSGGLGWLNNFQLLVVGYNCESPSGGMLKPMPIPVPAPLTFPAGVQLPVIPASTSIPVINTGTVSTATPGTAGNITFAKQPDGSLTPSISMPNCVCKDGGTPTFGIGVITSDADKPVSVNLRATGPLAYLFDMNLPGSMTPLAPLTLTLPIWSEDTQTDQVQDVTIYCPSDGTNDSCTAFGWIIEQLLELRGAVKPQIVTMAAAELVSGE